MENKVELHGSFMALLLLKAWCANNSGQFRNNIVELLYSNSYFLESLKEWILYYRNDDPKYNGSCSFRKNNKMLSEFGHGNQDRWIQMQLSEIEAWKSDLDNCSVSAISRWRETYKIKG